MAEMDLDHRSGQILCILGEKSKSSYLLVTWPLMFLQKHCVFKTISTPKCNPFEINPVSAALEGQGQTGNLEKWLLQTSTLSVLSHFINKIVFSELLVSKINQSVAHTFPMCYPHLSENQWSKVAAETNKDKKKPLNSDWNCKLTCFISHYFQWQAFCSVLVFLYSLSSSQHSCHRHSGGTEGL